jgi:hypothetical protein
MTEKQLQALVIECARWLQYDVYHTHDSRRSQPGFPDILMACKRGRIGQPNRLLVVELKSERGRLTPDQERWLALFEACGVEAYTWRPQQWLDGTIERILTGEEG